MPLNPPLSEAVSASFLELSAAAKALNAVSDELGKAVSDIDESLKKLNLGIEVWVVVYEGADERDHSFWSRDIGYSKIDSRWGIGLRKVFGNYRDPDEAATETWLFNDAPRSLRLEAIEKIPELLKKLSGVAAKTTKALEAKVADTQAVASAVREAVKSIQETKPLARKVMGPLPTPSFSRAVKP